MLSAGLCALQDGGKSNQRLLGLRERLAFAEGFWRNRQEYFTSLSEVLGHDFQKGSSVDGETIVLTDGDRESCVGDGSNKYCRCPSVQSDLSGYEGFLLRQPSSFGTTEVPSKNDPYQRSRLGSSRSTLRPGGLDLQGS